MPYTLPRNAASVLGRESNVTTTGIGPAIARIRTSGPTRASVPTATGLVIFTAVRTASNPDGSVSADWPSHTGGAVVGSGGSATFEPTITGWWSVDVTWAAEDGEPDTFLNFNVGGPPYHAGTAGGFAQVHVADDGSGQVSAHWQGFLGHGGGLAIGGDVPEGITWEAQAVGLLVRKVSI